MFIDVGSPVDVTAGPYSGRFGVVSKIRIYIDSERIIHDVMIFCELFNHDSGVFDCVIVQPGDLRRRRLTSLQIEQAQLDALQVAA